MCSIRAFVTGGHNWTVLGGSQPQCTQIWPLDFFLFGALFHRYLTVKCRLTAPSSDYFADFPFLQKWPKTGVKFWKLLCGKVTGRPKLMRFRKHLASLHSKMKIWPKRGGVFVQLLCKISVQGKSQQFQCNPPPPPPSHPPNSQMVKEYVVRALFDQINN